MPSQTTPRKTATVTTHVSGQCDTGKWMTFFALAEQCIYSDSNDEINERHNKEGSPTTVWVFKSLSEWQVYQIWNSWKNPQLDVSMRISMIIRYYQSELLQLPEHGMSKLSRNNTERENLTSTVRSGFVTSANTVEKIVVKRWNSVCTMCWSASRPWSSIWWGRIEDLSMSTWVW